MRMKEPRIEARYEAIRVAHKTKTVIILRQLPFSVMTTSVDSRIVRSFHAEVSLGVEDPLPSRASWATGCDPVRRWEAP